MSRNVAVATTGALFQRPSRRRRRSPVATPRMNSGRRTSGSYKQKPCRDRSSARSRSRGRDGAKVAQSRRPRRVQRREESPARSRPKSRIRSRERGIEERLDGERPRRPVQVEHMGRHPRLDEKRAQGELLRPFDRDDQAGRGSRRSRGRRGGARGGRRRGGSDRCARSGPSRSERRSFALPVPRRRRHKRARTRRGRKRSSPRRTRSRAASGAVPGIRSDQRLKVKSA